MFLQRDDLYRCFNHLNQVVFFACDYLDTLKYSLDFSDPTLIYTFILAQVIHKRIDNCIIGYGYGSGYDIYPMLDLDIGSGYISTLRSGIWI